MIFCWFSMGKSTIMVIFNSYAKLREGTTTKISSKAQQRPWLASGFDLQKPPAKWFANSKNMDGIETIQKNDQDIQDWVNSPTGSKPYKYRDDCCRSFNKKSLKKSSRLGVPLATLPITVFPELSSDWEKIISKITSSHPAVLDWIFSHLKIKTTTLNDYQIFWEFLGKDPLQDYKPSSYRDIPNHQKTSRLPPGRSSCWLRFLGLRSADGCKQGKERDRSPSGGEVIMSTPDQSPPGLFHWNGRLLRK